MKNEVFQNLDVILFNIREPDASNSLTCSPKTSTAIANFTEPLRLVAMGSLALSSPSQTLTFAFMAAYTTCNLYSR